RGTADDATAEEAAGRGTADHAADHVSAAGPAQRAEGHPPGQPGDHRTGEEARSTGSAADDVDGASRVQRIAVHRRTGAGVGSAAVRELAGRRPGAAAGLAVAGFVTADRRSVQFAPHLAWRHVPVADRISARLGMPVVLEHDANAAALAEHRFGAAKGAGVV